MPIIRTCWITQESKLYFIQVVTGVLLWTVLHCNCVIYEELCIVSCWPSFTTRVDYTLSQLAHIDLSCVDVPLNTKQNCGWYNASSWHSSATMFNCALTSWCYCVERTTCVDFFLFHVLNTALLCAWRLEAVLCRKDCIPPPADDAQEEAYFEHRGIWKSNPVCSGWCHFEVNR